MRDLYSALTISGPCGKTDDDFRPGDTPKTLVCDGCKTPVNDVSAMTLAEVEAMLAEPGGHCVRYAKDDHGRIAIVPDRPIGSQRWLAPAALSLAVAACDSQGSTAVMPSEQIPQHDWLKPTPEEKPKWPAVEAPLLQPPSSDMERMRHICVGYCNGTGLAGSWEEPRKAKRRHRKVKAPVALPGEETTTKATDKPKR